MMIFLFQGCILRFHVNLPGCIHETLVSLPKSHDICLKFGILLARLRPGLLEALLFTALSQIHRLHDVKLLRWCWNIHNPGSMQYQPQCQHLCKGWPLRLCDWDCQYFLKTHNRSSFSMLHSPPLDMQHLLGAFRDLGDKFSSERLLQVCLSLSQHNFKQDCWILQERIDKYTATSSSRILCTTLSCDLHMVQPNPS